MRRIHQCPWLPCLICSPAVEWDTSPSGYLSTVGVYIWGKKEIVIVKKRRNSFWSKETERQKFLNSGASSKIKI